jgi:hypothetical protein
MKIQRPFAFHSPLKRVSGAAARKRPSNTLDMQNLLHFSKELYAHALTLQEVIRNGGGVSYEGFELRPPGGTAIRNFLSRFQAILPCTNVVRRLVNSSLRTAWRVWEPANQSA